MKGMSFVELIAVLFAAMAGLASGVQAYVSWETRGEVSRAIVFAERLDACAKLLAAVEPFVAKAREEGRAVVAKGNENGRYSLPAYYYGHSSGNAAFEAKHGPQVAAWRTAAAAFRIVSAGAGLDHVAFFDRALTREIPAGNFMNRAQMLNWLEQFETQSQELTKDCRGLLESQRRP